MHEGFPPQDRGPFERWTIGVSQSSRRCILNPPFSGEPGCLPRAGPKTRSLAHMTLGPGSLINGKYRLGRQLGEGGMGAIYEARHEFLGTEVALKFLHPALSSRPNVVARFVQEARVSANIKSP